MPTLTVQLHIRFCQFNDSFKEEKTESGHSKSSKVLRATFSCFNDSFKEEKTTRERHTHVAYRVCVRFNDSLEEEKTESLQPHRLLGFHELDDSMTLLKTESPPLYSFSQTPADMIQ